MDNRNTQMDKDLDLDQELELELANRNSQIDRDRELAIRLQLRDRGYNDDIIDRYIRQDYFRRRNTGHSANTSTNNVSYANMNRIRRPTRIATRRTNINNNMDILMRLIGISKPQRMNNLFFGHNENDMDTNRETVGTNFYNPFSRDPLSDTRSQMSRSMPTFFHHNNIRHNNNTFHPPTDDYDNLAMNFINYDTNSRSTTTTTMNQSQHTSRRDRPDLYGYSFYVDHSSEFPSDFSSELPSFLGSFFGQSDMLMSNFIPTMMMNIINPQNLESVPIVLNDKKVDELKNSKISYSDLIKTDPDKKDENCPICLDMLKNGENDTKNIIKLPCNHIYHDDCVMKWLEECDYKCPVCRNECGKSKAKL